MRAGAIGALSALVLGAGAYLGLPSLISEEAVRARIDTHIGRWSGAAIRLHPDAEIEMRPGFRVAVSEPAFVSDTAPATRPVMVAASIEAPLRLSALLRGRVEIASLRLQRPDIHLGDGTMPLATWVSRIARTERERQAPLPEIVVVDGVAQVDGGPAGTGRVSDMDLRLTSLAVTGGLGVQGDVLAGDRRLRADLRLEEPHAVFSDRGTPGSLTLRLDPRLDPVTNAEAASETGQVDTGGDISSGLLDLARSVGMPGLGQVEIEGRFSMTPRALAISDATFSVGGLQFDGHLRAGVTGDRPAVVQLAALRDDAIAAFSAAADQARNGDWRDMPLMLDWLDAVEIDLSLTGEDLAFGSGTLDAVALSLKVEDGMARLDIDGDSDGFGRLRATATSRRGPGAALSLRGGVDDVPLDDVARMVSALAPPSLIGTPQMPEGTLESQIDMTARGDTLREVLTGMTGYATATLRDGSLAGTDVVATLDSLAQGREFMTDEKGPLIPSAGRTRFDLAEGRVDLRSGVAHVSDIRIAGQRFDIGMLGDVALTGGALNVAGNALLLAEPRTGPGAGPVRRLVDLPFGLGGTVFAPVIAAGVPTVETQDASADPRDAGDPIAQ